ncbi:MAG TPA: HDOD domain-containing protein [Syntrophales bacterium]|jgi:HD-like signal output (HDOD) protein|nr:HDOD domain-containing protein [Syntrophales bacterium]HPI56145.1 HDOD domain-containing protein [Syntrophales bacterium]HPN24332.1 HDOD domain-containing protein [Syntrophales bacterium]
MDKNLNYEIMRQKSKEGLEYILSEKSPLSESATTTLPQKREPIRDTMDVVMATINSMRDFGSAIRVYQAIEKSSVSISELINLIMKDPLLTAKILRAASSAYFGGTKINSMHYAIQLLGFNNVKNILFYQCLIGVTKNALKSSMAGFLWEHSVLTSICASYIYQIFPGVKEPTISTMGLLHDIGKFVNLELYPIRLAIKKDVSPYSREFDLDAERELFGIDHADIARLAFDQWKLESSLSQVIGNHHLPSNIETSYIFIDQKDLNYLMALFLANQIAKVFASEKCKQFVFIQKFPPSLQSLVDRKELEDRLSTGTFYSEINKTVSLLESYV